MIDKGQRRDSPPLQGRGRGWGVSAEQLDRLQGRARSMRNQPTSPEQRLWSRLRGSQLDGFKFRRQAVIAGVIVNFLCPRVGLVVEVDGHTHVDAAADERRDAALAAIGYTVLHVTNVDVTTNIEGVLQHLLDAARALPARHNPHPNPSPEGEGLAG